MVAKDEICDIDIHPYPCCVLTLVTFCTSLSRKPTFTSPNLGKSMTVKIAGDFEDEAWGGEGLQQGTVL